LGGRLLGQEDQERVVNWIQTVTLDRTRTFIENREVEIESEYQRSLEKLESDYHSANHHFKQAKNIAALYVGQAANSKPQASVNSGRREILYSRELKLAIEVSQSLLDHTRKLRGLLVERDTALRRINLEKFGLERELARVSQLLQGSDGREGHCRTSIRSSQLHGAVPR